MAARTREIRSLNARGSVRPVAGQHGQPVDAPDRNQRVVAAPEAQGVSRTVQDHLAELANIPQVSFRSIRKVKRG